MWWKADAQDLHRIENRVSTLYVERTHVDRDENAVVLVNKEHTVRVPAALVAVILLGPGTRITHGAMNLLGDSGTAVCWVGEHGVRLYACGLGPSRGARLLIRQAELVSRRATRLDVARRMYAMRFPDEDVSALTMQQLRGREGARIRSLYKQHARRTGVAWDGRSYQAGEPFATGSDVNRLLSAGHACLYGLSFAAICGLGASAGLGFVHTGSSRSFVMDIADLYKAETTIPLAFDLAANGRTEERDIRLAFRDTLVDGKLLQRMLRDILSLLGGGNDPIEELEQNFLWDDRAAAVRGGTNWARTAEANHVVVSGPEFIDEATPWQ